MSKKLEFNGNGFAYVKGGRYQIYCDADIVWRAVYHPYDHETLREGKEFLPTENIYKYNAINACNKHYKNRVVKR